GRKFTHRDQALFFSLSPDRQITRLEGNLAQLESAQLAHSQAAGVEQLEHCSVPLSKRFGRIRQCQQRFDCSGSKGFGQLWTEFRKMDQRGRIALDQALLLQKLEKCP